MARYRLLAVTVPVLSWSASGARPSAYHSAVPALGHHFAPHLCRGLVPYTGSTISGTCVRPPAVDTVPSLQHCVRYLPDPMPRQFLENTADQQRVFLAQCPVSKSHQLFESTSGLWMTVGFIGNLYPGFLHHYWYRVTQLVHQSWYHATQLSALAAIPSTGPRP